MTENLIPLHSCPHFTKCSGCTEQLSLKPPPIWLEVLSFFENFSLSPHLYQKSPLHWRHRAKMAVRGLSGDPQIGLFQRASHDVSPIPNCLVHHPQLNHAFELIRKWMQKNELVPYQEKTGKGDLRYLQGVVERASGKVQMVFVLNIPHQNSPKALYWQKLLLEFEKENPAIWHSLWLNFNAKATNTIFGPLWQRLCGEEFLWETFGEVDVCYGAASFGQANLPLFEEMLIHLRNLLPEQARVAEFYAGVGAIGLFIADKCEWVRCSEINPHSEMYFAQSCARLPEHKKSKLTFHTSSAKDSMLILENAAVAIVDPPRKGLDSSFFSALNDYSTIKQLIYVSCGWDALKRDSERLLAEGWRISNASGYHFFPGSNHVELMVNFTRNS